MAFFCVDGSVTTLKAVVIEAVALDPDVTYQGVLGHIRTRAGICGNLCMSMRECEEIKDVLRSAQLEAKKAKKKEP